jgi:hypothetical protein
VTATLAPQTPSRARLLLALSGGECSRCAPWVNGCSPEEWGNATPEEADGYDPAITDLPAGVVAELSAVRPASRVLLALNCGIGAGGFLPGNQCAKGGYGSTGPATPCSDSGGKSDPGPSAT